MGAGRPKAGRVAGDGERRRSTAGRGSVIVSFLLVVGVAWARAGGSTDAAGAPGVAAVASPGARPLPSTGAGAVIATTVTRIVDGDTIDVAFGDERVRLIGIDTPEVSGEAECFGQEASMHAAELVPAGTEIRLGFDVEERDRYGRLLAYVWRADGLFVNEAMVRDGYAAAFPVPPNVAHEGSLLSAERAARAEGRGLWSSCVTER